MAATGMEIWKAEIVSIGTEILMGNITDTNASFIAERLPDLGIGNYWVSAVGDNLERITEALERALGRSDIIFVTGGLGPTDDDMTRDGIAAALGETPAVVPELEWELRSRFAGRPMPERNMKQATLIPSAQVIPNPRGTAPGWWAEKEGHIIVSMPGVPREMVYMWNNEVAPRLRERMRGRSHVIVVRTLKTFGIGEGAVDERIDEHLDSTNPKIGVYARPDGTHVRINALGWDENEARAVLESMEERITNLLRPNIWGYDDDTVPLVLEREFRERGLALAVMESCTGGHVANTLTDVPDTSRYFKGGIIAYEPQIVIENGVAPWTVEQYGFISAETALAMAEAVRERLGADVGVGITGVPGPDTIEDKPVGLVFIAIADERGRNVRQGTYPQNRQDLKWRATNAVLFDLLSWIRRR